MTATGAAAQPFSTISRDVSAIVSDIRYATMTTVDRLGRPRARVLIAVWEFDGTDPVGWLGTYPTPVKVTHLASNPHVTLSYWSPRQDVVALDCVARWADDDVTRSRVFSMYRNGSPAGVGYEPTQFWQGPDDPQFRVLRLEPWRIQVLRGRELSAGVPPRTWRRASD